MLRGALLLGCSLLGAGALGFAGAVLRRDILSHRRDRVGILVGAIAVALASLIAIRALA